MRRVALLGALLLVLAGAAFGAQTNFCLDQYERCKRSCEQLEVDQHSECLRDCGRRLIRCSRP